MSSSANELRGTSSNPGGDTDTMKRAAAKNLIERYYRQLTEGCGNAYCGNANCYSGGGIQVMTRNEAAALALQLFQTKAKLCDDTSSPDHHAYKIPRSEPDHFDHNASPSTRGESSSAASSGPPASDAPSTSAMALDDAPTPTTTPPFAPLATPAPITVATTSQHSHYLPGDPPPGLNHSKSNAKSASSATGGGKVKKSGTNAPLLTQMITFKREPPTIDEEKLVAIIENCKASSSYSQLIRTIGETFNNPESLMKSFRKKIPVEHLSKEHRSALEGDKDKDKDEMMETEDQAASAPSTTLSELDVPSVDVTPVCAASTDGAAGSASTSSLPKATDAASLSSICRQSAGNVSADSQSAVLADDELSVDLASLRRCYDAMFDGIKESHFIDALVSALFCLAGDVEIDLHYRNAYERDKNYLNIFAIVFELPCLHSPEFLEQALPKFVKAMGYLPVEGQAKLARFWSKYEPKRLQAILETLQQLITVRIITGSFAVNSSAHSVNDDDGITGATKAMRLVYFASIYGGVKDPVKTIEEEKRIAATEGSASWHFQELFGGADSPSPGPGPHSSKRETDSFEDPLVKILGVKPIDCHQPLLPYSDFINEPLNDNLEMDKDYMYYKQRDSQPEKFSFLLHSFILTPATKNMGMYFSNRIRMINERRTSLLQSLVHGEPTNPYLRLKVRRSHLIDDALVGLEMVAMENPGDLKKQLYVEFDGEQGIDEGGVSKEFFQLVVDEIFNPDFGMFVYNDDTHQFWFNPTCFESDAQFTLIGIVLGLAIYNNVILDIHFPMVIYRKLLGKQGSLRDLGDSHPVLHRSLMELLSYEGDDVEDVFMLTFRISYQDVFGTNLVYDLVDGGDLKPVTKENKQDFVDLYADYLLNKSIEKQFRALRRGFIMVTNESPLNMLFRPDEVELLVCGSKNFDWNCLEDATDYDGGYAKDSETIRIFWDVLHNDFTEEQKRLFLQFTTGSDRAPIGGLGKLRLVIARNGSDSDRLPTSHTCFNVLLLPDYKNKEKLKERLFKAITYAKGFGML